MRSTRDFELLLASKACNNLYPFRLGRESFLGVTNNWVTISWI